MNERLEHLIEYLGISFSCAFAVLLIAPSSRGSWRIFVGSAIIGGIVGYGASAELVAVLTTAAATVTAPATIMKMRGKSLDELALELSEILAKKKDDNNG